MFTGIIEGLGKIAEIKTLGQAKQLTVESDFELSGTRLGDSIAVSGACLTVVEISGKRFCADVSPETLERTTFNHAKIGDRVNLERALRLSDRLDGHLVSGHIDGMGTLRDRKTLANAIIISVTVPQSLAYYMISKGSVAVDGISLTINHCRQDGFDVSIIPHTAKLTTIGFKKIGDSVNIETDLIGKYVERFVSGSGKSPNAKTGNSISKEFLAKSGFMTYSL